MEHRLCKEWGCTPSQLRKERNEDVQLAFRFMDMEGEVANIKSKEKR
jgi:hypothetical protein